MTDLPILSPSPNPTLPSLPSASWTCPQLPLSSTVPFSCDGWLHVRADSPLCASAAACSSRRSDTRAGPCRASVFCRKVRTGRSRTGRGLGWTWCLLERRTARFQHPAGTAAHMGVRCSPRKPQLEAAAIEAELHSASWPA